MQPEQSPEPSRSTDSRRTSRSLLARARNNEPDAWQRLTVLYGPLVRFWCRRGSVADQDVDDVVQEVFTTAFSSLAGFRHTEATDTFRGWLKGVTRNRMLEHFRRVRRHVPATGGSTAQGMILNQPDPQIETDAEEEQLAGQLYQRALELIRGEFEARTWQTFWRSVVEGVPTAVVATEQGVSPAAVRQARTRILRRLREEVGELDIARSG